MISIDIICPGKIKEKYFRDAIEEYKKRLSRFAKVNIIEVKDEPTGSDAGNCAAMEAEEERILSKLDKRSYMIALCVEGKQLSSEEFAEKLNALAISGTSRITFVIGGSCGLSENIKNMADMRLGFSKMTFPHRLMRVILLEQIYRAFTINNGITYHK